MHHFLKRFITPLAILLTTQIQSVGAETIRLVGPDGNIQSAPQYSQPIGRNTTASAVPSNNTYGPTRADETLWSIATRLRPSNAVSIQQTLLAIYRLNPQAFDNQNIHELIPGSNLRVPSLAQARAESTEAARRILEQHQQKPDTPQAQPATGPAPAVRVIEPEAEPVAKPEPVTTEVKPTVETKKVEPTPVTKPENRDVKNLKDKLGTSEGELVALEEKNHKLRLLITDLQGELGNLKEELGDESRIRSEVEKMLEEERKRQAELEAMQPSQLDLLIENKLFLALLALVPGSVLVLALVMFLTRRRHADEVGQMPDEAQVIDLTEDEDIQEINLDESIDDDLNIEDDLFGEDSEENIFDVEDTGEEENDIFANLDDSDLDFNLDDGEEDPFASIDDSGELADTEALESSSNGISVDGDDKALSLEEMERALDEGVSEPSTSEAEIDDFDLSDDDDEISQDELNELLATDEPTEALDAEELDQSMLDDLFNQTGDSQEEDDQNGLNFESLLSEEPLDESAFELSEGVDDGEPVLKDEEIDDLLAELEPTEDDLEEPAFEAPEAGVDLQEDTGDMLSDFAADDVIGEESIDLLDEIIEDELAGDEELPELDENSTELLDELIDEGESELGDFDLGSESTALLDEIVDSEEGDETLPEITDDTTELLDELLGDGEEDESFELDAESTALLDELVDDDDLVEETGIELDENSTELLDELIEDEDFADDDLAVTNDIAQMDISDLSKDDSDIPDVLLEGFEEPEAEAEPELEEVPEEVATSAPEQDVQANEFGVPQDDDWLADDFEDEAEAVSEQESEPEPEQAPEPAFDEILADSIEQQEAEQFDAEAQSEDLAEDELHLDELADIADIADDEVSEFDEQAAFEELVSESLGEELVSHEPHADELADIADDEIGEFDEQSSFEELITESLEHHEAERHEKEFEPQADELDQISDDDLGEFDEMAALEAAAEEEGEELTVPETEAELDELFELSDDDLGEFDEMAALEAAAEEEGEELTVPETEAELDELLELSDDELGEFDESALLDELLAEDSEPEATEVEIPQAEASEQQTEESNEQAFDELDELLAEVENGAFDESAMAELLDDEPSQDTAPLASQELDSETIDSAGMDLGAMLDMGEDWNGFNLSPEQQAEIPEEVPEDQQAIWGVESEEPQVQEEDWGNQPSVDELETSDNQFMSVDELMAQVESSENESDPDEEELNLDVGLNEFPDVIGNIEQFDVDAGGEAAGKLDLAKIYIEMNDNEGAIKLLEEAIVYGEDATRQEAKALIDKLNGQ